MLNIDFQPLNDQNENPSQSEPTKETNQNEPLNMDFIMNDMNQVSQPPKIDKEEENRICDRIKEAEERKAKINEKIKKEEELRNEIRKKGSEYMVEFEQKRQEEIAKRRKELEQKSSETNTNTSGGNNADSWEK